MALSQLSITDFRNLAAIHLEPLARGFNFFYGQNGSGKTSFLEAIYYLGHGRSFRSLSAERIIRYNSDRFNIISKINEQFLGLERNQEGEFQARLAGQELGSLSELAALLPMRLMNVHSHHLIEGSPTFRRKYLDWGIFYHHPEFHPLWFRFKRLLKQRNAALRRRAAPRELASWTQELAEAALAFHHLRLSYLDRLLPLIQEILSKGLSSFFDLSSLTIDYLPGWDLTVSYEEILQESLPRDLERGSTFYGPHRADLSFKLGQIPAKDVLSTGQQKLVVCGMILAQGALLGKQMNKKPIYLIDDLPSELDSNSRHWFLNKLAEQEAQIFVTAVEPETMNEILAQLGSPVKMFHVKHGAIQESF